MVPDKTALTPLLRHPFFQEGRHFLLSMHRWVGSINPADWLAKLRLVVGDNDDSYEIFKNMPHESAVIINDLELWWERTNDGYAVLKEIIDLIRVFGRKIFYYINCNSHSFNQINSVFPIEDNFLSVIECNPFDAKRLQKLIQRRHKTSGLIYNYRNISEESVSQIKTASLFNDYFSYSHGIPGVAMNTWIGNITKIDKQVIFIKKPELPNIEVLNNINPDWLIVIALFIQHKNMSADKLAKVLGISKDEAENIIYNLSNARILELRENNIHTLGRYLEPFLVKICQEKGII